MPFILRVDTESNCLLVLWSGQFSKEGNISFYQALSKLTATECALPRLHDARKVNFDVPTEEIYKTRRSGSGGKDNIEVVSKLRSAVLVHSDLDFGMMRILSAIYNRPELDVQVFSELEKAKEWVGMNLPGDPFEGMANNNIN